MIFTDEKSKIIPQEMKSNIDKILNEQLLNANRNYAITDKIITFYIEMISKLKPSEFLIELKKRWNWHNHFYEELLEPAYLELKTEWDSNLTPIDIEILIEVYETMVMVDEATLITSGAIKKVLDEQLPYVLEIASTFSDSDKNEFMLLTPAIESYYVQYQADHLSYILLCRTDEKVAEKFKKILLKKFHANDEEIFKGRFKEFEKFFKLSVDELIYKIGNYAIPSDYKISHRLFLSASDELKAYSDIIKYDNVDEKFIASSLIGISGFLLRKNVLKILNDSGALPNNGYIYAFPNALVISALKELLKERKMYMDKDVRPYKQKGNTCAIVCMMMLLEYYKIIPKADWQKERMYYRGFKSQYMEGTPFSAIAWFMANSGLDVKMLHSEECLFRNDNGYIPNDVFDFAVKEYKEYIDKALETGATIENGIDFNSEDLKKQLENDGFVVLAGMVNNYLHAILVTGYDEDSFIICDPLYKQKQHRTFEEVDNFMQTPIGKWCLCVKKPREKTKELLQETGKIKKEAEEMKNMFSQSAKIYRKNSGRNL